MLNICYKITYNLKIVVQKTHHINNNQILSFNRRLHTYIDLLWSADSSLSRVNTVDIEFSKFQWVWKSCRYLKIAYWCRALRSLKTFRLTQLCKDRYFFLTCPVVTFYTLNTQFHTHVHGLCNSLKKHHSKQQIAIKNKENISDEIHPTHKATIQDQQTVMW